MFRLRKKVKEVRNAILGTLIFAWVAYIRELDVFGIKTRLGLIEDGEPCFPCPKCPLKHFDNYKDLPGIWSVNFDYDPDREKIPSLLQDCEPCAIRVINYGLQPIRQAPGSDIFAACMF